MIPSHSLAIRLLAFIGILAMAPSCNQDGGGSVVGNGLIHYYDKEWDFGFDYEKSLRLTRSPHGIAIDNESRVKDQLAKASRLTFEVIPVNAGEAAYLIPFADAADPGHDWQPLSVTGVGGAYYEESSAGHKVAKYFFRLSSVNILQVELTARAEGGGLKFIPGILDTLSFDTQSPVIHEMLFEPPVIKAGETAKLRIRVTDNLTAIHGRNAYGVSEDEWLPHCRKVRALQGGAFKACGEFLETGGGWHELAIPTNPRLKPDAYYFDFFTLWDTAGNQVRIYVNDAKDKYTDHGRFGQASLPVPYLRIENERPDTANPVITEVRFEPPALQAGDRGKLLFKASDDDPGFEMPEVCWFAKGWDSSKVHRTDVLEDSLSFTFRETIYVIEICGTPVMNPSGYWEIGFRSEKHMAPGRYDLAMALTDAASNTGTANSVITILNDGEIETEGPKLLNVIPEKNSYRAGEKVTFLIRAWDDHSKVFPQSRGKYQPCTIGIVPVEFDGKDDNRHDRIPFCSSHFRHLQGEWYAAEFLLGENIPIGEYYLPEIWIQDAVGNANSFSQRGPTVKNSFYWNSFNQEKLRIPVATFKVTR